MYRENTKILLLIYSALGLSAFFNGFYGVLHYSDKIFLQDYRLSGTLNDPNYTAMAINIGILSLLYSNPFKNAFVNKIIIFVLIIFLLFTISLQGLLGAIIFTSFYIISRLKTLSFNIIVLFLITIFSFNVILNFASKIPAIELLSYRIESRYKIFMGGDYSKSTSGRYDFNTYYLNDFKKLEIENKVFGGTPYLTVEEIRNLYLGRNSQVTHNSFIDMLFYVGFFGTIVILLFFMKGIVGYYRISKKIGNEPFFTIVVLKLYILYTCLGISIFPYKWFTFIMFM
jgi:O-antigen ligase